MNQGRSDTVVVGLGNPILRDDSVGVRVVRALSPRLRAAGIAATEGAYAGLGFLDVLAGFQRAIIIDAIRTKDGKPGDIYCLDLDDIETRPHTPWSHHLGLATVLKSARDMGVEVPAEVTLFAIEVKDVGFGEGCTPKVKRTIPRVVKMLTERLGV